MRIRPADTSPEAWRAQVEMFREMGPARRQEIMVELSDGVRANLRAGIAQRHPDYDDDQIMRAMNLLLWGPEMFKKIFPGEPLPAA